MTSAQTLIVFALLLAGAGVAIVYFVTSQIKSLKVDLTEKESDKVLLEWLKDMRGSVEKSSDTMEKQLKDQRDSMDKQTKMIWERLDNAAKVIGGVQKHLGGLEEFNKDMKDLSNILKSPKLRGGLGEQFLYEILENALPKDLYKTQYKFRDGSIADAVLITEKGMIPVDSKFSMENFKAMITEDSEETRNKYKKEFVKDVKKRIDEISKKYILPEEGTTDQAIMYIPSENIYYELIVNTPSIEEYAQRQNVLLTSPNTFSYFVKIVMVAYQQNELAKHAGEILKALSGIRVEAEKFGGDLDVLDGHITRTTKSMDNVKSKYGKLSGKIEAVQALGKDEPPLLEE
ncbi:DNA recombination protein RmuC [candidate division WWE3 bacterium]|jgi:DNA recombination protein RmuC|nr:DNA recombination protein RmuC [candidate division WWE3 bacterium]MBT7350330.1 DNA recombination protein RmuC [candidate division WWE3 bacterium]